MSKSKEAKAPYWFALKNKQPPLGKKVRCLLQHWNTLNILEVAMVMVKGGDHNWRTADDNSELSFDWTVIGWRKA